MTAKTMTTREGANRLVELCRKGLILEAQQELFADDVTSHEPEHSKEHFLTALSLPKSETDKKKIKIKLDAL